MNRSRSRQGLALAAIASALRPHAGIAGVTAASAVPLLLLAAVVPNGLFLPILSLALLTAGGVLALIAWRTASWHNAEKITIWDLCGACAFIGFAAAILSNPENVVTAFAPAVGG